MTFTEILMDMSQISMLVTGVLHSLADYFGVTYKVLNVYLYFVLYPLSFTLFFKGWKKFLFLPISLLFFLIPNYAELSVILFDLAEDFLHSLAGIYGSNYLNMSVYFCVWLPVILYVPLVLSKINFGKIFTRRSLSLN